jgi:2-polyprenyl-3-methyl-5-hydroxy-6-metoxy-1,4-benzoquinol methylase
VVQRFWHSEKLRMIDKFSRPRAGENVLDIGCGSGVIADALREYGANVVGVDGNQDAIAYARRTFGRDGIEFRLGQVEDIEHVRTGIDRSYCFEVVEHLYINQVETLFRHAYGLSRPGATLTVTTPNYAGVWPVIEWTLDALKLVPHLDGDQHVTHFTAERLVQCLRRAGWEIELSTTFSTIAPWAAVLGWRFAKKMAVIEDSMKLRWGSILFAVARKPVG